MSAVPPEPDVDIESALDHLIDAGAVDEADDGALTTTAEFENTRRIYHDTYGNASDERFYDTVGDLFAVGREDAVAHVDATGLTREELVAYLAVRSFLEESPTQETLAVMADIVVQIGPGTPIPPHVRALTDDDYEAFLADHPDALVTVWKHGCDPCEAMKADLDAILERVPEDVAVAGIDGEEAAAFRRAFEVSAAPAVLLFRGGDLQQTLTGRKSPAALGEEFESVYE